MNRRARLVVLCAAGVTASVVALVLVARWPALMAEYHASRLERARTYEEAKPWLAAIEDDVARGAAGALFARLRSGTSYAAFWVFTFLCDAGLKDPTARAFEERLRAKDELMRVWSHYVRWTEGTGLFDRLDSLSPQETSSTAGSWACGTMSTQSVFTPDGGALVFSGANVVITQGFSAQEDPRRGLDDLAIIWFLGAPMPPPGEAPSTALGNWLMGSKPFLRSAIYDEKLGRCKREDEADPFPAMEPFAKRSLPVPEVPLPGWEGAVPEQPQRLVPLQARFNWASGSTRLLVPPNGSSSGDELSPGE